jgi:hypothetical protein
MADFKVGQAPWETGDKAGSSFKVGEAPWEKKETTPSIMVNMARAFGTGMGVPVDQMQAEAEARAANPDFGGAGASVYARPEMVGGPEMAEIGLLQQTPEYKAGLQRAQQGYEGFKEEHPIAAYGTEYAPMLASLGPAALQGIKTAPLLADRLIGAITPHGETAGFIKGAIKRLALKLNPGEEANLIKQANEDLLKKSAMSQAESTPLISKENVSLSSATPEDLQKIQAAEFSKSQHLAQQKNDRLMEELDLLRGESKGTANVKLSDLPESLLEDPYVKNIIAQQTGFGKKQVIKTPTPAGIQTSVEVLPPEPIDSLTLTPTQLSEIRKKANEAADFAKSAGMVKAGDREAGFAAERLRKAENEITPGTEGLRSNVYNIIGVKERLQKKLASLKEGKPVSIQPSEAMAMDQAVPGSELAPLVDRIKEVKGYQRGVSRQNTKSIEEANRLRQQLQPVPAVPEDNSILNYLLTGAVPGAFSRIGNSSPWGGIK